ncbi:MAG TPA: hypothetical protein VHO06_17945 [Polyangia bacterium]|nr:hypothetical protein [Polyangia bacterium]
MGAGRAGLGAALVLAFLSSARARAAERGLPAAMTAAHLAAGAPWSFALRPPTFVGKLPLPTVFSILTPTAAGPPRETTPLLVSLGYLRLAVTGDDRAGLSPFLGTSTSALGGLRLRF